jgi:hypothetical protein
MAGYSFGVGFVFHELGGGWEKLEKSNFFMTGHVITI